MRRHNDIKFPLFWNPDSLTWDITGALTVVGDSCGNSSHRWWCCYLNSSGNTFRNINLKPKIYSSSMPFA